LHVLLQYQIELGGRNGAIHFATQPEVIIWEEVK